MATTGVLVAVFLIGVVVGRGAAPETVIADATGTTLEAAEAVAPQTPDAGPPSAEPPAPVPEEPDQFSYHERLQQSQPADDKVQAPPSAPPAAPAAAPEPQPPTAASGWVVQIGAYRERATADRMVASLKEGSFPAFVLPPSPGSPTATFRVRVGPYRERRDADAIAGRLMRERKFDAHVTR